MVATVTLIATPDPTNAPPRMQLDVTATGTPTVSSVTISRTDPDGSVKLVRTADGGPLVLSGGAATIYDPEIPYGVPVDYSIEEGSAPTTSAQLDVDAPWLTHLGVPSRSVTLDFLKGSSDEEEWVIDQGVFPILGRATPIVVTGAARQAPSSMLLVGTESLADLEALRDLLADGSVLLLNVSPALGLGLDTAYIAVGNAKPRRRSDIGTDPQRNFQLPYQVVGRPAGGTRSGIIWADVAAEYATWSSIPVGKTWAQLAAGT